MQHLDYRCNRWFLANQAYGDIRLDTSVSSRDGLHLDVELGHPGCWPASLSNEVTSVAPGRASNFDLRYA